LKNKWRIGWFILLLALIMAIGLAGFSCVKGLSPIGWSGGAVSDGTLYVGSREGRLVSINLTSDSRLWSEALKAATQPGLFGCSPYSGGGCGSGSAGVAVYGTPVIYGELVYMAGYNGKIYACNIDNLATRWVYPRGDSYLPPIVGGLTVAQDKIFFGCTNGEIENKKVKGMIIALDAATGDLLYQVEMDDKIWSTPAIEGDILYIGSFDKKLYALNIADGTVKWEFTTEGAIVATPLVADGTVYVGSLDRNLYVLNASDGGFKWKFTARNQFWAAPVLYNDMIYAGCLDSRIYIIRADNGEKVAEFDLGNQVSAQPVVVGSSIIFATRKGAVYSVDTDTNQIRELANIKSEVNGPLTAYNGIIYLHTQDLMLQRVNASDGSILTAISLHKSD
jgi:outer membrane protein assembly factor BamB